MHMLRHFSCSQGARQKPCFWLHPAFSFLSPCALFGNFDSVPGGGGCWCQKGTKGPQSETRVQEDPKEESQRERTPLPRSSVRFLWHYEAPKRVSAWFPVPLSCIQPVWRICLLYLPHSHNYIIRANKVLCWTVNGCQGCICGNKFFTCMVDSLLHQPAGGVMKSLKSSRASAFYAGPGKATMRTVQVG